MTTQKDNAVGAMQDFFPNGGREWDAIGALYDAIAAGKIPGVVTGEKVAELEQRLQQPIKLPDYDTNDYGYKSLSNDEVVAALKEQGFKVEGE